MGKKRTFSNVGESDFPTGKYKKVSYEKAKRKPKTKRTYGLEKAVSAVLVKRAEKKEFINYGANQSLFTAVATSPVSINLMPNLQQGTSSSQRIGNEVTVTNGWLRLAVNLLPYNAVTNPNPAPLYCKVWIIYSKAQVSSTLSALSPPIASTFFKVASSNTGFQGNMLDITLPVNENLWGVLQHQTKRLGVTGTNGTGPASTGSWMDNSTMSQIFDFDLTRHYGKLQYNDTTSNDATNKSMFAVIQVVNADGSSGGSYTMAEYHYSFCVQYTDV